MRELAASGENEDSISEDVLSLKIKLLDEFYKDPNTVEEFKESILSLIEKTKRCGEAACGVILNQKMGEDGFGSDPHLLHQVAVRCSKNPVWIEIFKAMVEAGADLSLRYYEWTAWEMAILGVGEGVPGHGAIELEPKPEIVEYLVEKGFSLNHPEFLNKLDKEIERSKRSLKEAKDSQQERIDRFNQIASLYSASMHSEEVLDYQEEVASHEVWMQNNRETLEKNLWQPSEKLRRTAENFEKIKNLVRHQLICENRKSSLQSMLYRYVLDRKLLSSNSEGELISNAQVEVPKEILEKVKAFERANKFLLT